MEYTTSSIVDSFPFEPTDINASNLSSVNESSESNMSKISYLTPRLDMEEEGVTFAKVIELYVVPILVVTGAIGNCLILLTVRQRNMRNWSICFYLAAYAVGNIIILVPMVGAEWLCHVTSTVYITKLTDWTCKLWQFIMGVTIYSGIWFVFAMLVDQYIAIWLPYKAQSLCTIFMAKCAIVIIIIGLTVVSVHAIWTYELFQNGCYILHTPNDLLTLVWPWVSLSFYCIIPLVLIFIFIALVLYGTFTKTTWKKSASNYQVPMDITVMTIALSIFYVIFVTPATVINIIKINLPNSWLHDEEFYRNLVTIVVVVGDLLTYLNPTLAFVICFAFSSTFRLELKEIIRCMCCENVTRIYEMQVNSSASGAGNDPENCSETTPL